MKRPALRYFGGKFKNARKIIAHFPPHKIYVEPFGGAASVLLAKQRSYSEVYNDLFEDVVNVFRVLRDPEKATLLQRACELTPYSFSEFRAEIDRTDPIEWARQIIFKGFAGFGSGGKSNANYSTGFRADSMKPYSTPAHDWMNWPSNIRLYTQRLSGVIIENREASAIILKHDTNETLHYLDPPYMHGSRSTNKNNEYTHEMTDLEHEQLLKLALTLQGKVAISGYRTDLYDDYLNSWKRIEFRSYTNISSKRTECLWMNYNISNLFSN